MQNEVINILKKEEKFSDETIKEIREVGINDFADIIKEVGQQETEYLKRDEILKDLNTNMIGKELYIFKEVMSTNTVAKFLSENGVPSGTVVLSEKQSNAKGRQGKAWESPLGGIWLSLIVNPQVDHSKIPMMTLATGVVVVKTLEKIGINNAEIKWPNDIYAGDRNFIAAVIAKGAAPTILPSASFSLMAAFSSFSMVILSPITDAARETAAGISPPVILRLS